MPSVPSVCDPGRCTNCGGPISDELAPDCPHGLYRGDWCDDCGDEVPYPPVEEYAPAEGGGSSEAYRAAWRQSDEAHR